MSGEPNLYTDTDLDQILTSRDAEMEIARRRIAELEVRIAEGALDHTRVMLAVHDWIALDAPLTAKMNLRPTDVAKLVDRICGSVTTFHKVK